MTALETSIRQFTRLNRVPGPTWTDTSNRERGGEGGAAGSAPAILFFH